MFLSRIRGGRNPEFPILDKWSHTHNAKDAATVYNATRCGRRRLAGDFDSYSVPSQAIWCVFLVGGDRIFVVETTGGKGRPLTHTQTGEKRKRQSDIPEKEEGRKENYVGNCAKNCKGSTKKMK